jgi:LysE type translocator
MTAGAVGVSALVMASAEAFTMLKILGVAYLVWLGLKAELDPLGNKHSQTGRENRVAAAHGGAPDVRESSDTARKAWGERDPFVSACLARPLARRRRCWTLRLALRIPATPPS